MSEQIKKLEQTIRLLEQKNEDQLDKNRRLNEQHTDLQQEFENYRQEKVQQERKGNVYLKECEFKLTSLSK